MLQAVTAIDELRGLRELRDRDATAVEVEVEDDRPDIISIWIGPATVRPIPVIGGVTIAEVVSVAVFLIVVVTLANNAILASFIGTAVVPTWGILRLGPPVWVVEVCR